MQEIMLRHTKALLVPDPALTTGVVGQDLVATLLKNLEQIGWTFDLALIQAAQRLGRDQFVAWASEVEAVCAAMIGAHVKYAPFYPNFPQEVMALDEATLYLHARVHYLTGLRPTRAPDNRTARAESTNLTIVGLGQQARFWQIFADLLAAPTSLSEQDVTDLQWLVATHPERLATVIGASVPHKETRALLGALIISEAPDYQHALPAYPTATDVLRLAVAVSGGDVSLSSPTRFVSFRRPVRRLLLSLFDQIDDLAVSMQQQAHDVWQRLAERLHPQEHAGRFPNAAAAFAQHHARVTLPTAATALETALAAGDVHTALTVLEGNPGALARRLDHLVRVVDDAAPAVLAAWQRNAHAVATPVVLQVLAHFTNRTAPQAQRLVFPKGQTNKVQVLPPHTQPLDARLCAALVATCEQVLRARFAEREPLGLVYVDPAMDDYPVPLAQRGASESLRTLPRGSMLPLAPAAWVRLFVWWIEAEHGPRLDVDLSAVLLDERWQFHSQVSYTSLRPRTGGVQAVFSGDLTAAPPPAGAAEFIDLHLNSVVGAGARYVVVSVRSFTEQPFAFMPGCAAGWMLRDKPTEGEAFDARTVWDRFDLTTASTVAMPYVIDVKERRVHWVDLSMKANPNWVNNVEGNLHQTATVAKAVVEHRTASQGTLFRLHAEARGRLTDDRTAADIVFAPDGDVQPTAISEIAGSYL